MPCVPWKGIPAEVDPPVLPLLLLLLWRLALVRERLSWGAVRRLRLRRLAVPGRRPCGVGGVVAARHATPVLDHAHQHILCTRCILALR